MTDQKGAQASCLFLQNKKATGKMPVLLTSAGKLIDDALEAAEKEDTRKRDLRLTSSSSLRRANRSSPLPDTFTRDPHPDLRADFVMALPSAAACSFSRSHPADRPNGRINPPFNIKEWWDGKLEGDARWS